MVIQQQVAPAMIHLRQQRARVRVMIGFWVWGRVRIKIRFRVGVTFNISTYHWSNWSRRKCPTFQLTCSCNSCECIFYVDPYLYLSERERNWERGGQIDLEWFRTRSVFPIGIEFVWSYIMITVPIMSSLKMLNFLWIRYKPWASGGRCYRSQETSVRHLG